MSKRQHDQRADGSSADRDGLSLGHTRHRGHRPIAAVVFCTLGRGLVLVRVGARLAMQEAGLLDGASRGRAVGGLAVARGETGMVLAVSVRGGEVGDVLGDGVLAADGAGVDAVALAGLAHGIVAAVEVLALLQVLGKMVGLRGQLAVETEEALLIGRQGLFGGGVGGEEDMLDSLFAVTHTRTYSFVESLKRS